MKVVARKVDWEKRPPQLRLYAVPGQTFLSPGRAYEVHALAVFEAVTFLLVIDDQRRPHWSTSWLFDVSDGSLPSDWICTPLHDDPQLIMGPEFIARDEPSYRAMVELEHDAVAQFWLRVERLREAEDSE